VGEHSRGVVEIDSAVADRSLKSPAPSLTGRRNRQRRRRPVVEVAGAVADRSSKSTAPSPTGR
jgi:hypothetical protein